MRLNESEMIAIDAIVENIKEDDIAEYLFMNYPQYSVELMDSIHARLILESIEKERYGISTNREEEV